MPETVSVVSLVMKSPGVPLSVAIAVAVVLHALQLAADDLQKWCGKLEDDEVNVRPAGAAPVAFHMRHLARSLDRLLTYAEGKNLTEEQMSRLRSELDPGATRNGLFEELTAALMDGSARIRGLRGNKPESPAFSHRYCMIAVVSQSVKSPSTRVGAFALALRAR